MLNIRPRSSLRGRGTLSLGRGGGGGSPTETFENCQNDTSIVALPPPWLDLLMDPFSESTSSGRFLESDDSI